MEDQNFQKAVKDEEIVKKISKNKKEISKKEKELIKGVENR
ncbi:MAG: hypothetical protein ACOX7X_08640 [Methanosarcina flavescens]